MATKFVFRKNQTIGNAAAELDGRFLSECFVDTGELAILKDCGDARRILVGRTGAGKSALLARLAQEEEHVISLQPESLSLVYITNSGILRFLHESGVHLDPFFRLLWRHVLCVEILKERFQIDSDLKKQSFVDRLWQIVSANPKRERALRYLRKWGESFWEDSEYRIEEVTKNLETKVAAGIEAALPGVGTLNASAAKELSDTTRAEIVRRAQPIVNEVQVRELSDILDLLNDVLCSNPHSRVYVTVDRLDEDWVEDYYRYRLIRALVTTALHFVRVANVKVIVAVRQDLLDRVFRSTRDSGFQAEKYRTSMLDLSWNRDQLMQMLDRRINLLVKSQYTNQAVSHKDVLPEKVGNQRAIDYIVDRTLMRPRDVIQFFNESIKAADGSTSISGKALQEAEGAYSRGRLIALADEWSGLYPHLMDLTKVLKGGPDHLLVEDLDTGTLQDNVVDIVASDGGCEGEDGTIMKALWTGMLDPDSYRRELVHIFYRTGLIGLKTESFLRVSWSHEDGVTVSVSEIKPTTRLYIHRTFWRTLGIGGAKGDDQGGRASATRE